MKCYDCDKEASTKMLHSVSSMSGFHTSFIYLCKKCFLKKWKEIKKEDDYDEEDYYYFFEGIE